MGWNWIEDLGLAAMLAQEQYEQEQEETARRVQKISRQYQQEIATATQELYQQIVQVDKAFEADKWLNEEEQETLAQGAKELVLYAFYEVLHEQGGRPTQEQNHLLEIYCEKLQLPYNEMDFLLAVNFANGIREHLESLFKQPKGSFWQAVWKLLRKSSMAEEILNTLVQLYGDIVMRFSMLGDPDSEAPVVIMNQMVDRLNERLVEEAGGIEEKTPHAADYVVAYRGMTKAYEAAAAESRAAEDGLPVQDLYVFFVLGLIHQLLRPAKLSFTDKAAIIDGTVRSCQIPVQQLNGMSILESIYSKDEIGGSIQMMTEFGPEHGNLWQIMQAMCVKCGQAHWMTAFLEGASLFMQGLEQAILKEYPGAVQPGKAAEYINEAAELLSE